MTEPNVNPLPLGSLLRKACIDAGFDLEPERDGEWWRLRASGAGGVVWVRPAPVARVGAGNDPVAVLALPLMSQLAELSSTELREPVVADAAGLALPIGAAGAVICSSATQLYQDLRRIWTLRANTPERLRERWNAEVEVALEFERSGLPGLPGIPSISADAPLVTEALAHVRRRVGQDVYRDALMEYWGGQCAVTGLAIPELLRASHAKPWAVSSDAERMDVHNGLLLAVHLDALFDNGFLSFDDDGAGILSPLLPREAAEIMGLAENSLGVRRLQGGHLPYLSYHRTHVFMDRDEAQTAGRHALR